MKKVREQQTVLDEQPKDTVLGAAIKNAIQRAEYEAQALKDRNRELDELEAWQAKQAAIEEKQRAETAKYIASKANAISQ